MGIAPSMTVTSISLLRKERFLEDSNVEGHDLELIDHYSAAVSPITITHELNQPTIMDVGFVYLPNERNALSPEDLPDMEDIIRVTVTQTIDGVPVTGVNLFVGFITEKPKWNFVGGETTVYDSRDVHTPLPRKGGWTYNIKATGLEWLINTKGIPQRLTPYVNKSHRFILVDLLTKILSPVNGQYFIHDIQGGYSNGVYTGVYTNEDGSAKTVNEGNIESFYKPDPRKKWSEIANEFGAQDDYRYWISGYGDFNYEPVPKITTDDYRFETEVEPLSKDYIYITDDATTAAVLGYRPVDVDFHSLELATAEFDHKNDVTVIGDNAPSFPVHEEHLADGKGAYRLKDKPYGIGEMILIEDEWSSSLDTTKWHFNTAENTEASISSYFEISEGVLNIKTPPNADTPIYTSYIRSNQAVEMSGCLVVRAGELRNFTQPSSPGLWHSYVGCLRSTTTIENLNPVTGMEAGWLMGSAVNDAGYAYVEFAPIYGGSTGSTTQVIISNQNDEDNPIKSIIPIIHINVDEPQRVGETGSSTSKVIRNSNATLRFELLVYSIEDYTKTERVNCGTYVIPMSPTLVFFPAIHEHNGSYGIISTSITRPIQVNATILEPGSTTPRQIMLGQSLNGCDATIQSDNNISSIVFYDTLEDGITTGVPKKGSKISISYWAERQASARVKDSTDIQYFTVSKTVNGTTTVFDDGVRAAVVSDMTPKPRNDKEAELAARAYLENHLHPQWEGSYSSFLGLILTDTVNTGAKAIFDIRHYNDFVKEQTSPTQSVSRRIVARVNEFTLTETGEGNFKYSMKFKPRDSLKEYLNKLLLNRSGVILNTDSLENDPEEVTADVFYIPEIPPIKVSYVDKNIVTLEISKIVENSVSSSVITSRELVIQKVNSNWSQALDKNIIASATLSTTTPTTVTVRRTVIGRYTALYAKLKVNGSVYSRKSVLIFINYPKIPAPITYVDTTTDIGTYITTLSPIPAGTKILTPTTGHVWESLEERYYSQDIAGFAIFDKYHNLIYKGDGTSDKDSVTQSPALGTCADHDYLAKHVITSSDSYDGNSKTLTLSGEQFKTNQFQNYYISYNNITSVIESNTSNTVKFKTTPAVEPATGDVVYIHVSWSYTSEIDGYRHKFIIPNTTNTRTMYNFYERTYNLLDEYDASQEVFEFSSAAGAITPKYPIGTDLNRSFVLRTNDWIVLKNDSGSQVENGVWKISVQLIPNTTVYNIALVSNDAGIAYAENSNMPSNIREAYTTGTSPNKVTTTGTRIFKLNTFVNDAPEMTDPLKYDHTTGTLKWKGKNADGWRVNVWDSTLSTKEQTFDVTHGPVETVEKELALRLENPLHKSVKHAFTVMGYDDFGDGSANTAITFDTAQDYTFNTGDIGLPTPLDVFNTDTIKNSSIQALIAVDGSLRLVVKRNFDFDSLGLSGVNSHAVSELEGMQLKDKEGRQLGSLVKVVPTIVPPNTVEQNVGTQVMVVEKPVPGTVNHPNTPLDMKWWGYAHSSNGTDTLTITPSTDYTSKFGSITSLGEDGYGYVATNNMHSLKTIEYNVFDKGGNGAWLYDLELIPIETTAGSGQWHAEHRDVGGLWMFTDTVQVYVTGPAGAVSEIEYITYPPPDGSVQSAEYWNPRSLWQTPLTMLPRKLVVTDNSVTPAKKYIGTPVTGYKDNGREVIVVGFNGTSKNYLTKMFSSAADLNQNLKVEVRSFDESAMISIPVSYDDQLKDISIPLRSEGFDRNTCVCNVNLTNELGETTVSNIPFFDESTVNIGGNPTWDESPTPTVSTRHDGDYSIADNTEFKIVCALPDNRFSYAIAQKACMMEIQGTSTVVDGSPMFMDETHVIDVDVAIQGNGAATETMATSTFCVTTSTLVVASTSTSITFATPANLRGITESNKLAGYYIGILDNSLSQVPHTRYKVVGSSIPTENITLTVSDTESIVGVTPSVTCVVVTHIVDEFKGLALHIPDWSYGVHTRTVLRNTQDKLVFSGAWEYSTTTYSGFVFTPLWNPSKLDANNGYQNSLITLDSSTTGTVSYKNADKSNWYFRVRFWNEFGRTIKLPGSTQNAYGWSNPSTTPRTTGTTGTSYSNTDHPSWPVNSKPSVDPKDSRNPVMVAAWTKPTTNIDGSIAYAVDYLDHNKAFTTGSYSQDNFTFTVKGHSNINNGAGTKVGGRITVDDPIPANPLNWSSSEWTGGTFIRAIDTPTGVTTVGTSTTIAFTTDVAAYSNIYAGKTVVFEKSDNTLSGEYTIRGNTTNTITIDTPPDTAFLLASVNAIIKPEDGMMFRVVQNATHSKETQSSVIGSVLRCGADIDDVSYIIYSGTLGGYTPSAGDTIYFARNISQDSTALTTTVRLGNSLVSIRVHAKNEDWKYPHSPQEMLDLTILNTNDGKGWKIGDTVAPSEPSISVTAQRQVAQITVQPPSAAAAGWNTVNLIEIKVYKMDDASDTVIDGKEPIDTLTTTTFPVTKTWSRNMDGYFIFTATATNSIGQSPAAVSNLTFLFWGNVTGSYENDWFGVFVSEAALVGRRMVDGSNQYTVGNTTFPSYNPAVFILAAQSITPTSDIPSFRSDNVIPPLTAGDFILADNAHQAVMDESQHIGGFLKFMDHGEGMKTLRIKAELNVMGNSVINGNLRTQNYPGTRFDARPAAPRQNSTAYVAGDIVSNGGSVLPYYSYMCVIAGTTASTSTGVSSWSTVPGTEIIDGTVTWECIYNPKMCIIDVNGSGIVGYMSNPGGGADFYNSYTYNSKTYYEHPYRTYSFLFTNHEINGTYLDDSNVRQYYTIPAGYGSLLSGTIGGWNFESHVSGTKVQAARLSTSNIALISDNLVEKFGTAYSQEHTLNTVTYARIAVGSVTYPTYDWAATTAYHVNDLVKAKEDSGVNEITALAWRCAVAGTSSDTSPFSPTTSVTATVGNVASDGPQLRWECVNVESLKPFVVYDNGVVQAKAGVIGTWILRDGDRLTDLDEDIVLYGGDGSSGTHSYIKCGTGEYTAGIASTGASVKASLGAQTSLGGGVALWAGSTLDERVNAPFRVLRCGDVLAAYWHTPIIDITAETYHSGIKLYKESATWSTFGDSFRTDSVILRIGSIDLVKDSTSPEAPESYSNIDLSGGLVLRSYAFSQTAPPQNVQLRNIRHEIVLNSDQLGNKIWIFNDSLASSTYTNSAAIIFETKNISSPLPRYMQVRPRYTYRAYSPDVHIDGTLTLSTKNDGVVSCNVILDVDDTVTPEQTNVVILSIPSSISAGDTGKVLGISTIDDPIPVDYFGTTAIRAHLGWVTGGTGGGDTLWALSNNVVYNTVGKSVEVIGNHTGFTNNFKIESRKDSTEVNADSNAYRIIQFHHAINDGINAYDLIPLQVVSNLKEPFGITGLHSYNASCINLPTAISVSSKTINPYPSIQIYNELTSTSEPGTERKPGPIAFHSNVTNIGGVNKVRSLLVGQNVFYDNESAKTFNFLEVVAARQFETTQDQTTPYVYGDDVGIVIRPTFGNYTTSIDTSDDNYSNNYLTIQKYYSTTNIGTINSPNYVDSGSALIKNTGTGSFTLQTANTGMSISNGNIHFISYASSTSGSAQAYLSSANIPSQEYTTFGVTYQNTSSTTAKVHSSSGSVSIVSTSIPYDSRIDIKGGRNFIVGSGKDSLSQYASGDYVQNITTTYPTVGNLTDYYKIFIKIKDTAKTDASATSVGDSVDLLSTRVIRMESGYAGSQATWVSGHTYAQGEVVRPTAPSVYPDKAYQCTSAGNSSASTEPAWSDTPGASVSEYASPSVWAQDTTYNVDDIVRPTESTTFPTKMYICTTAGKSNLSGTEPTWTGANDDVVKEVAYYETWQYNTVYTVGSIVRPINNSLYPDKVYLCTTEGSSSATTEPTWSDTLDATVMEDGGDCVWKCVALVGGDPNSCVWRCVDLATDPSLCVWRCIFLSELNTEGTSKIYAEAIQFRNFTEYPVSTEIVYGTTLLKSGVFKFYNGSTWVDLISFLGGSTSSSNWSRNAGGGRDTEPGFVYPTTLQDSVQIGGGVYSSELRIMEPSGVGTAYTGFTTQEITSAGNVIYTLPADFGSTGQILSTTSDGILSWITPGWKRVGTEISQTNSDDTVNIGGGATPAQLKFMTPMASYYTAIQAGTQSANITYTLPTTPPQNNYVLGTNGSGALSWVLPVSGTHPDPHRLSSGTTSAPSYSFASATTYGMSYAIASTLCLHAGTIIATVGYSGANATLKLRYANTGVGVNYLQSYTSDGTTLAYLEMSTVQLRIPVGTLAAPGIAFTGNTGKGLTLSTSLTEPILTGGNGFIQLGGTSYSPILKLMNGYYTDAANRTAYIASYSADGAQTYSITLTASKILNPSGTLAAPGITFTAQPTMGMSLSSSNEPILTGGNGFIQLGGTSYSPILKLMNGYYTDAADRTAYIAAYSADGLQTYSITLTASKVITPTAYWVGSNKVVGARGAAVTKPTADVNSLKTAVDAIIDRLGATLGHGLIA